MPSKTCVARWAYRSTIEKFGTVVGIGGGSGIAVLHHLLTGHRDAGNHIIGVVGARQKDLLILEDEMRALCDELIVTTDDRSYGVHGKVTDALAALVERHEHIDRVIAVGPLDHDARRDRDDAHLRPADGGQPEPDHGRRHRYVWRLPLQRRR